MEVYLTSAGEVTCGPPAPADRVADLLAAMATFGRGAVDCAGCRQTCCAGLPVFADNVFVRRLCALAGPAVGAEAAGSLPGHFLGLDAGTGHWLLRPDRGGRCRFLAAQPGMLPGISP